MIVRKKFEVGDVIVQRNCFCTNRYPITRVTKTQAISENEHNSYKFRINYELFNEKDNQIFVKIIGFKERWDMNKWFIEKKNNDD